MGMDVTVKVIVGIKLEYAVETKTKTKYNEDTGVPYHTTKEIPVFKIGDIVFSKVEDVADDFEDVVHYCDYDNKDNAFLGFEFAVASTHSYTDDLFAELNQDNRNAAKEKLEQFIKEHELEVPPELIKEYVVMNLSY